MSDGRSNYDIFQTFYQEPEQEKNKKQKNKRFGWGALIGTAIVSLVIGALVTLMILQFVLFSSISGGMLAESGSANDGQTLMPQDTSTPYMRTPAPLLDEERPVPTLGADQSMVIDPNQADVVQVAEAARQSVVGIITKHEQFYREDETGKENSVELQVGNGSGVVLSKEGYIVTNYHVIASAENIYVLLNEGTEEIPAEIIGTDAIKDICILKVDRELVPIALGNSDTLKVGEKAIALGNPMGMIGGSVTLGIISAVDQSVFIESEGTSRSFIQTDAAINPGNSGGALVNAQGQLIGINTLKSVIAGYDSMGNAINAEGIGYAIPIDEVLPIAEQLIRSGRVNRPGIGVTVMEVTQELADEGGVKAGVLVTSLVEGGAADKAGIKINDIITAADGEAVASMEALVTYIQEQPIGSSIEFEIERAVGDLTLDKNQQWETIKVTVVTEDMNAMRSGVTE